ncbi:MAG TPA: hypothetical protein VGK19_05490 [Capsulimonadaceae bacterium]|jgi:hypothetical protein
MTHALLNSFRTLAFATLAIALAVCSPTAQASPTVAGNDIVYCARYYNPPGTRGNSSFHIYTVSPNGMHRKQLTFDNTEMEFAHPKWSPDGKLIAFIRPGTTWDSGYVWVMDENGKHQRRVARIGSGAGYTWDRKLARIVVTSDGEGDSAFLSQVTYDLTGRKVGAAKVRDPVIAPISPDGKLRYDTESGQIIDNRTGAVLGSTMPAYPTATWVDNSAAIGIVYDEAAKATKVVKFGVNGRATRSFALKDDEVSSPNSAGSDGTWLGLTALHSLANCYLAKQNWHNSTVGTDCGYFIADLGHSTFTYLAEGQFAAWSPDQRSFATAPGRDTANYERHPDGTWRTVWVAPLQVVSVATRRVRTIQGGLVWVTGADWRVR